MKQDTERSFHYISFTTLSELSYLHPRRTPEGKYKDVLAENFGILFNSLFTMTNMPIKRFADFLHRRDELKDYMELLVRNFNPDATTSLMCLDTVSVGYNGKVRTIEM
jgi:Protein of unknown function (DUF3641)